MSALVFIPTPARAQSTQDRIARTRQRINEVAQQWFATQAEVARIDGDIAGLEQRLVSAKEREQTAARVATQRAIIMYKGASSTIPEMTGASAMDSARKVELIDRANADNRRALEELDAASEALTAQRDALSARRADQTRALDELASERASLDSDLASLTENARREAAAAAAAQANAAQAAARTQSQARPRVAAQSGAPTRPANVAAPPAVGVAAASVTSPARSSGPNPHHDDPFLTCTRAREAGGDYTAVSPAGYYGVYQFAPTTWDVTASRAGRLDLVGVLPSHASAYDQDELAWILYQWQGKRPWNGRC